MLPRLVAEQNIPPSVYQELSNRQSATYTRKLASEPIDLSLKRPSDTITHGGLLAAWGELITPL
jgi:hypothetical protein